ncbi:MAG: hypothetical protein IPM74_02100 [Crocinitomicaceae bacterium]|nr:hypothetical protein [Crocinitomicaceae bacterium]MBK8924708.1 hypothetical protein [Crocinitomicaceae bacterium]
MKTNKINVVLSLNKTVVTTFENEWNHIIKASGTECAVGATTGKTLKTVGFTRRSKPAAEHCIWIDSPNYTHSDYTAPCC